MPSVSRFISFFVFLFLFSCNSSKIETIDFSDGSYEGELNKKKQKHGKGFFRWSDGSYYNGLYENDKRHGQGRFLWANGETYEGSYVHDVEIPSLVVTKIAKEIEVKVKSTLRAN